MLTVTLTTFILVNVSFEHPIALVDLPAAHLVQYSFSSQLGLTGLPKDVGSSSEEDLSPQVRESSQGFISPTALKPSASYRDNARPIAKIDGQLNQADQGASTNSLDDAEPTAEKNRAPIHVPGNLVTLQPEGLFEVPLDGDIKFTVILINRSTERCKLTGELIITKGDGTTETLLAPRAVKLKAGQKIQLPVVLGVSSWHLPPGETEFLAILRDMKGEIIDKASATFKITVALDD